MDLVSTHVFDEYDPIVNNGKFCELGISPNGLQ